MANVCVMELRHKFIRYTRRHLYAIDAQVCSMGEISKFRTADELTDLVLCLLGVKPAGLGELHGIPIVWQISTCLATRQLH